MSENLASAVAPKGQLLIVEDSIDYRTLLKKLFSREGYGVLCASHGQDALYILRNAAELPDLILLDLMMPIMDGFEFRDQQLADARLADIPVILMTAHGNLQVDPVKMQIRDCVRKPVEMTQLLSMVESLVN